MDTWQTVSATVAIVGTVQSLVAYATSKMLDSKLRLYVTKEDANIEYGKLLDKVACEKHGRELSSMMSELDSKIDKHTPREIFDEHKTHCSLEFAKIDRNFEKVFEAISDIKKEISNSLTKFLMESRK